MKKMLPEAFSESLKENSVSSMSDILEVGIDSFLDDGIAKDIPLISTVIGIYKVGKSINDLHNLKKLKVFVYAINDGIATKEDIIKYKIELQDNPKKRQQELEYILIIINRYINYEKPQMLAKVYLAYLDKKISWDELTVMAEIIDRLLPGDYKLLTQGSEISIVNDEGSENALRLMALGLVFDAEITKETDKIILQCRLSDSDETAQNDDIHKYIRTELGNKMSLIIR